MPLDATRPPTKLDALADQFAAITLGLKPKSNTDAVSVRYVRAKFLLSKAEKEAEAATKEAVAAGVLPDHATTPLALGTHPRVFHGEFVDISCVVVAQAEKFDQDGFAADLLASGVKAPLLKRLLAKHTRPQKNAHRYSATLIGN